MDLYSQPPELSGAEESVQAARRTIVLQIRMGLYVEPASAGQQSESHFAVFAIVSVQIVKLYLAS